MKNFIKDSKNLVEAYFNKSTLASKDKTTIDPKLAKEIEIYMNENLGRALTRLSER